jgi:hypothetical protein
VSQPLILSQRLVVNERLVVGQAVVGQTVVLGQAAPQTALPAAVRELPAPPGAATAMSAAVDLLDMAPGG